MKEDSPSKLKKVIPWTCFPGRMILPLYLIVVFCSMTIHDSHAQNMQLNLNLENSSVLDAIKQISSTTGMEFFYNAGQVSACDKRLSKEFINTSLTQILDFVLDKTSFKYRLEDKTIVIVQQPAIQDNPQVKPIELKGVVSASDTQEPLPGVTILIEGTQQGTATNANGEFILPLISDNYNIVFSFIGYEKLVKKFNGNNAAEFRKIQLTPSVETIEDVVVTGYFNKNKSSFTGTAKSYTAEELKQVNPVNLLSALSILDPSFKMVENNLDGSNPNVIPDFQIRGSASMPSTSELESSFIGNPNMPTFILDGFEVSAEKVFDLDPMRIESMTILKDAAATAIYGSRASNGVVVINTKQPEVGKLRAIYNLDLSFNIPDLSDYDLLNASEKLQLEKAAGYFDPLGTIDQTEARERDYNYRLGLVEQGYNTYWLDKPLEVAIGHKHSLSIEGGEKSIRYSLDLTYEDVPGVMKESGRTRTGMGTTLLYRFKNLTFRNSMTYDNVKSVNSPYGSFRTYALLNPYYPYQDENGNYLKELEESSGMLGRQSVTNPLYNTTLNVIDETSYSEFANNFGIDWYINTDLRLKGNFAIRHKKNEGTVFKPADHTDFINYSTDDYYRRGYYQATSGKEFFYDGNVVLSYFKQLQDHALNANIAWNIQGDKGDVYTVRAEGFPDEKLDFISFAAQNAETYLPTGEDYISRLMGFVGNAGYTYLDRYLLDASVRFDGSSKFGSNGRWATFWSVGLGWNIHKEKFAADWDWADMLKIRASYGMTGSQAFEPYQSIIMYEYYTQNRYRYNIGAIMKGLGNPDLKWQQTNQLNIGTDISILNGRFAFSANYYQNRSKDLLTDVTLPPSLGYGTYRENLGEVENKGYELEIRLGILKKNNLWVNLTASGVHNTNILKKISNSLEAWNKAQNESEENLNVPKVLYIEGESINSIWGVPSLGINPANGKETYIAADGSLTDVWSAEDQRVLGCTDPDLEGNLGVNAGWKGFQLNLYFRYRIGGQSYNYTLVERVENADKRYNTDRRVLEQRWQNPGDITFFKDIKDNSSTRPTSRFVEDYNYLQLSSFSLSYDFPTALVRKWRMENIRLSFSMNDVFRASSIKAERGLDYPFAKAFRTSLRVTF